MSTLNFLTNRYIFELSEYRKFENAPQLWDIQVWQKIQQKLLSELKHEKIWRRSGVFIVNFEHISYLILVFLLLTLNM